jgi:predicted molibdopterin-dependent oxidoreductase YjgC
MPAHATSSATEEGQEPIQVKEKGSCQLTDQLRLTINGTEVSADQGTTVLGTAQAAGIYIPALCHDPDLTPTGDCRLCLVEIEGTAELATACTTPATGGMVVHTDTPKVNEARREALVPILTDHPSECLICDRRERCHPYDICLRNVSVTDRCVICLKNEQCQLQKAVDHVGITEFPARHRNRSRPVDNSNPFFQLDRNYCILCRKCVRACAEVTVVGAIEVSRSQDRDEVNPVGTDRLRESICRSCGECMARCPTGALAPKSFRRPEEEVETICPYCGVGCGMYLGICHGQIVSVRGSRENPASRGRLCVKGRFGIAEFVHHPERLTGPLVKRDGKLVESSWDEALDEVTTGLRRYQPDEVAIISSAKCTNEENYLLQKLGRAVLGTHNIDHCARL